MKLIRSINDSNWVTLKCVDVNVVGTHLFYWNSCRMTFRPLADCLNPHIHTSIFNTNRKSSNIITLFVLCACSRSHSPAAPLFYYLMLIEIFALLSRLLNKYSPEWNSKMTCVTGRTVCTNITQFIYLFKGKGMREKNNVACRCYWTRYPKNPYVDNTHFYNL